MTEYVPYQILTAAELNASIDGLAVAVSAAAASIAAEVMRALASEALFAPVVSSITALRALTSTSLGNSTAHVVGYYTANDGGEGKFWRSPNDTTSSDNGGTIIVDASGRRWYRETQGRAYSIRWFGATGLGVTNDSPAFQATAVAAIAAGRGVYAPAAPVYYLLQTAINLTTIGAGQPGIVISGDGCYPCSARITPTGGSTIAGATGAGGCVFDCTGSSGVIFRDLTIASIGITNASTIGVIMGNSSALTNGGSSCGFDNVSIMLPATGSSLPLYGINVNLLTMNKLNTMGDYGVYISNANDLSITRPYGVQGANIQSDGVASFGCFLGGYGTQSPFILKAAASHKHDQLYIVNLNGSNSFSGKNHAIEMTDCTDISMKVEIDYFPSAVAQFGVWIDVDLSGIIYAQPSPLPAGVPAVASLVGTSLKNCNFAIRALSASTGYTYGTASSSPTEISLSGCRFIFDTAVVPNCLYCDVSSSAAPVPIFNCYLNGNTDGPPNSLQIDGSSMPTSAYRLFINGLRTGVA